MLFGCAAVDGDTIRCDGKRYRLLAIDAPEMPGHCRRGRRCVPGDPLRAKEELQRALRDGRVRFQVVAQDRYGRSVGIGVARGVNLSCHMLRAGHAAYVARYDTGSWIRRACPDIALAITAD
jgi:micrococcal nuclease